MSSRVEVWKECAQWLTRCGVLREDHKANWPDSVASDLAMTLRDGVLLCTLLIKIEPNCIDSKDVNQKPRMAQFLCLRNIRFFLQACRDSFGLRDGDLFEPQCLFDLTDFLRVLHTLSKLSLSPKFQQRNLRGFAINKARSLSQDDIYKNLSSSEGPAFVNPHVELEEYSSHHVHMRSEEIYQDLCSISRRSQQLPSAQPVSLVEKRDYVINELVETEKKYIDVLSGLQKQFMKPLAPILTEEDFKTIFFGIKELHDIHVSFLADMLTALTPGSKHRLSEVFLVSREKFLVYGDYIANLTGAKSKIADLYVRDEFFHCELQKCEDNIGKFKLRDILTVPMQRILKYHLLLDRLVAETSMSHEDYRGLERAKESMVDIAQYLNEVNRDSEALVILMNFERTITEWAKPPGTVLHHYGRYILDGELRIKAHFDQKQKLRNVFIFDTAIVICKALKGDLYQYKDILALSEYRLQDIERRNTLTRDARWSHQWYLVHRAEKTAYTCYSKSEEFKRKAMKAIEDALDNIEPPGHRSNGHKFKMHTFETPTTCCHCSKFLKGKIYQGYECEVCRITAHKMCLPHTVRCGAAKPAPVLPPRLPIRSVTPVAPPAVSPVLLEELERYMWFVGEMGREKAATLLENRVDGTYLLRVRPQGKGHPSESVFSLSLKTDGRVRHMKIYEQVQGGVTSYHFSAHRYFKGIVELVTYYEKNCLGENFQGLTATLKYPFRQLVVVAEFDFNPTESNQLPLRTGCQLVVLSKEGDSKGWWRGTTQNREGFFPKQYVREISDTLTLGLHEV